MIHNWGYYGSTHGPAPTDWHTRFKVCGGKKQSPIHIKHATAQYSPELSTSPWRLHNYDKLPGNTKTILQNNGHTVVVKTGDGMSVSGGGLPGDYKLLQFHLHWGSHNANGSEHLLDNKQYPAEIHLVHSNMYYGKGTDTDAIMANNDGLAVLGIFVEVGDYNPDFDPIIQQISKVEYMSDEDHVDLKLTSIRHLLPDDMSEFYRYSGSLTTPPCSEIVVWTVFKNPIRISQEQLNMFRTEIYSNAKPNATSSEAHDDDAPDKTTPAHGAASGDHGAGAARHIVDNFRPLQELGYRVVKYAKIDMNLLSAGVRVGHSVCVMLAVVCVTILKVLL